MADDSLPLVGRRADLVTYYEARAFLDRRFSQFRYQAVNQLNPDEPTHAAVALRVIDKQWASAARALRLMLLPQRRRRKKLYRPVATRNPVLRSGPKVRVRRSIAWRRKHGWLIVQRGPRRPHRATGRRRGRPALALTPEKRRLRRNKRRRELYSAKARTAPRRPYKRRTDAQKARLDAQKWARSLAITAARAFLAARIDAKNAGRAWRKTRRDPWGLIREGERFLDERSNHDARYGYGPPLKRQRATSKQASAGRHFRREAPDYAAAYLSRRLLRVAASIHLRRSHMLGYWREVHRLAGIVPVRENINALRGKKAEPLARGKKRGISGRTNKSGAPLKRGKGTL